MAQPRLAGALQGLKVLDVSDLPRFRAAVEEGQQTGWAYYFPYLMARDRGRRNAVLLGEESGSLCIFQWKLDDSGPRLDLLLAPSPMNPAVAQHCLERANDFNGDRSARILRIDAKDVAALSDYGNLRIKQRKSQYLYAPADYADIGGRRYRTLRRQVQAVQALPDLEVVPYSAEHAEDCHALLREWGRNHRQAHGTAGGVGTTARALDLAEEFEAPDLIGELILIGGRLSAFAFGGRIRSGVACFFDAKCASGIPGLSYFQRYRFLTKLSRFALVNDGSDAGRSGLRQLKESLRPAEMHAEYRASQERALWVVR